MTVREQRAGFVALPEPFSISHYGPTTSNRTREYLIHGRWWQFVASELVDVLDRQYFQSLLAWLARHPYALFTDDLSNRNNGIKRKRVDIQKVLQSTEPPPWIGPDVYDSTKSLLSQKHIAEQQGINCQVAAHVAAEFLGKVIYSRGDKSEELFSTPELYQPLNLATDQLVVGDILFFHEEPQIRTAKALHLAVLVGHDSVKMPWVLHATAQYFKRPAAEIIPLSSLFTNKQKYFYGAVRLSEREPNNY